MRHRDSRMLVHLIHRRELNILPGQDIIRGVPPLIRRADSRQRTILLRFIRK